MTALVIGGTGMLAGATRRLLRSGTPVVSVARRPGRLPRHAHLTELSCDWSDPDLSERVCATGSAPFDTALLWVHLEHRRSVYAAVADLIAPDALVVEVSGSGGARPEERALVMALLGRPDRTLRQVLLGSVPSASGRRWLTDGEISDGAWAAMTGGPSLRWVGEPPA